MTIETNCPNCSSDNTVSVSMVIAEITAVSRGHKIGKGDVAFLKKYAFSKQATSGCIIAIPLFLGGVSLILGIVFAVIGDQGMAYIIPSYIIGAGLIAFGIMLIRGNSRLEQQKTEHSQWLQKLWICRKCGHEWIPK